MTVKGIGPQWPEGLTDEEAVQRLRTLCLGACDGIQDLADDARYKALRKALILRADLRPLTPSFVAAQAGLDSFVRHVRETKDRSERRDMVRVAFEPLQEQVRSSARSTASSDWTGRLTPAQRAEGILKLAPSALAAVEALIAEEEVRLGNGGPVEPDRETALACLREFHSALGELIRSAERKLPLEHTVERLRGIRRGVAEAAGRAAGALPITASAMTAFGTVVGLTDLLIGNLVVSLAAGGLAGNTMKDVMLKKDAKAA